MKKKTARRKLNRLSWKMARARYFGSLRATHGLGKQWKRYIQVLMGGGA